MTNNVVRAGLYKKYGERPDGTPKNAGWQGEIQNPDGSISTELSIGVNIDGQELLIPLITPTSTPEEIQAMRAAKTPQEIPQLLVDKAVEHAMQQIQQGQPPFKE